MRAVSSFARGLARQGSSPLSGLVARHKYSGAHLISNFHSSTCTLAKEENTPEQDQNTPAKPAKPAGAGAILTAGIGAFGSMACLCGADMLAPAEVLLLTAPMGASAALVFGGPALPFSQPRNVIGGHVVSAVCGVATSVALCSPALADGWHALCDATGADAATVSSVCEAAAVPVSVSTAIMTMMATGCMHPPSAATAMLAVVGSEQLQAMDFAYVGTCGIAATTVVGVGFVWNNLVGKKYPA